MATKVVLQGWKDEENSMPKWMCRFMWITYLCTRYLGGVDPRYGKRDNMEGRVVYCGGGIDGEKMKLSSSPSWEKTFVGVVGKSCLS
ncbi:hypothetical protein JHK82_022543 [Glycine max]|nr:hypothetical protein JHK85_023034 [Glycine max]KAG5026646.1 hypothetical protein JHK86_022560 [Glycine max]KAG5137812.1 hypothetical protein JHK82_022543 [Glycine max]